jgi:hypothetical protein
MRGFPQGLPLAPHLKRFNRKSFHPTEFSAAICVMEFKVGSEFEYEVKQRSTVILNVHVLRTPSQEILEEHFFRGAESPV